MVSKGLTEDRQFRAVYRKGTKQAGKKVIVYYLTGETGGVLPGFVASKRVGKANERNRAKRLMREIFRQLRGRIIEENIWIVFIASFKPQETDFGELFDDIEGSMARAGLISANG